MKTGPILDAGVSGQAAKTGEAARQGGPLVSIDSELLKDVPVRLEAKLGDVSMSIGELLALKTGGVVKVDRRLEDQIELRLNGAVVAIGEIVAVGDNFGIRVMNVAELP